ncbi:MAG: hypothetical protein R3C11_16730 [Planctomycetaceae bacterium]
MTRQETAHELQTTDATIKARLASGKELLKERLPRRGIPLAALLAALGSIPRRSSHQHHQKCFRKQSTSAFHTPLLSPARPPV